jgi:predicted DNA-binding ArsR family transcriptional regulator
MATKRTVKKTTTAPASRGSRKPAARTTATKAPARATVKKETVEKTTPVTTTPTKSTTTQSPKARKAYIVLVIIILLLGAALYYFRGLFVAAVVNGQPISRWEVIRQTEQQSGKTTLDTLVRNTLIEQKAREANVSVSDKEINDEITKLQGNLSKQGQNLDQVLTAQGMSKDDLKKLIRLDKLVAKMVGKDVTVSDKEVTDYIEKNKEALPQGADEATLKKQVADQLKQQKTNDKVRAWLADIEKQSKIVKFVDY